MVVFRIELIEILVSRDIIWNITPLPSVQYERILEERLAHL